MIIQLTSHGERQINFIVSSPDRKRFASTTSDDNVRKTYVKRIDRTGTPQHILTHPDSRFGGVEAWATDGNHLTLDHPVSGRNRDIHVYSFEDSTAQPFLATPAFEADPSFSPNGKWLLYMFDESGQRKIYVRSYLASSGSVWKISTGGGEKPAWSRDVHPDGDKFIMIQRKYVPSDQKIFVIQNFAEESKRLVPAGQ